MTGPPRRVLIRRVRVPTAAEYAAYDGAHCRNLWRSLPDSWRCPGCGRSKFELLTWTRRTPSSLAADRMPYWGWLAILHRHHDHSLNVPWIHPPGARPRFAETVICGQCNGADGVAKRDLGLPAGWSFTPAEIGQFITPQPHGPHRLDLDIAAAIHRAARPAVRTVRAPGAAILRSLRPSHRSPTGPGPGPGPS